MLGGDVPLASGVGSGEGAVLPPQKFFLGILCERMHFGAFFIEEYFLASSVPLSPKKASSLSFLYGT